MNLKNFKSLAVTVVATAFFVSCSQDEAREQPMDEELVAPSSANIIEGQYIVVFNKDITGSASSKYPESYTKAQEEVANTTKRVLNDANIPETELIAVYSKTINGAALKLTLKQVEALRGKKEIAFIEEDRIVQFAPPCGTPNGGPCDGDPGDGDTGGGDSAQDVPYGIVRVNGVASYTGSNVAWVIDSGIDTDHPDLNVDASRGFNAFTSGRDGKSTDDGNGHGTHVAGTIAALNNDFGVVGVAPGAVVVPVKVLDSRGSGSYSGVIAGVDHVAAYGSAGDVANMSLGGPISDALDNAVLSASENGIIFALAAGNESSDANNSSPARVNGPNIVTISAMDANDNWASFSNYGNPPVDYAAPGVAVNSTWKDGGYNSISGTSMASPHAAGVLLLGSASTDGTVNGDPDGTADAIIVH
ncbi:S8 family serine peptidase [Salegentibacter sp. LM13S]|uniref:S8 family serine peptidase n=1 Tax=Salegentibacter lacus TaxID=2873599 RepID=UPI001CCC4A10|nr:S8 family serine peptidase [Salegentibacter lacus]MBZ9630788.1 S8 family serine peptidase [Salegentibacter lacus]